MYGGVGFDASASYDGDATDLVSFRWDLDGDGNYGDGGYSIAMLDLSWSDLMSNFGWASDGWKRVSVEVTDDEGQIATASVDVPFVACSVHPFGTSATSATPAMTIPTMLAANAGDFVDLDLLADFVDAAYAQHGQAPFLSGVHLQTEIVSSVLPVADYHHRVSQRMGPGFEGFFLAQREPSPELEFVEFPYFHDLPYTPDSPLEEMVILRVNGEMGFTPLDYEAFVFRFASPGGSCRIELMDPVFPGVSDFADDRLLALVFPDCEGPQATRERVLLEAIPDLVVTGIDANTGSVMVSMSAPPNSRRGDDTESTGPEDNCPDYVKKESPRASSSSICADWAGAGKWVRGGGYWQDVICVPQKDGCTVRTVTSGDDLHSSIRPTNSYDCDCCKEFGATVTGATNSAQLFSSNGDSGGHVAIAKSRVAWRNQTSSTMEALELEGECGGALDLPFHGSNVSVGTSRAFDYTAKKKTQNGKHSIGIWNAENITSYRCTPGRAHPAVW